MKHEKHITHILDENSFNSLSEDLLAEINLHTAACESCRQSFHAFQVSSLLFTASASEIMEPPPFFHTKVMAALREKQTKSVAAFWRWWQASSPVFSLMVIVIAVLTGLTLFAPNSQTVAQENAPEFNSFSAETVILNQDLNGELTSGQVLEVIYEKPEAR